MFHAAHVTYSQSTSTSSRILSCEQLRVSAASVSITSQIPDKPDRVLFSATHAACTTRLKKNKQITTYYVPLPLSLPLEKFLGSEAERLASFSYCKLNVTTPVQLYPQQVAALFSTSTSVGIFAALFLRQRALQRATSIFLPRTRRPFRRLFQLPPGLAFYHPADLLYSPFARFSRCVPPLFPLARCSSSQRPKRLFRLVSPRVPLSGPRPIENRVNDFAASRWRAAFAQFSRRSDRSSEMITRRSRAPRS